MIYNEVFGDLFDAPEDNYLVHCISSDFVMGAGIAPQFTKRFNTKYNLMKTHPNYSERFLANNLVADCLLDGRVFNLITKHKVWQKPTYDSMHLALRKLLYECEIRDIKKLAMPKIGCGLDGLNWERVSQMIREIFEDTDIQITIYYIEVAT